MLTEANLYEFFGQLQDEFFTCDLRDFCYHLDDESDQPLDEWEDDTSGSYSGYENGLIDSDVNCQARLEYESGVPYIYIYAMLTPTPFEAVEEDYPDEDYDSYYEDLEKDASVAFRKECKSFADEIERTFRKGEEFDTFIVRRCDVAPKYDFTADMDAVEFSLRIRFDVKQKEREEEDY